MTKLARLAIPLGIVLLLPLSLFAQRDLGTILGVVTDPSDAAVPRAQVRIEEQQTGLVYDVITDGAGNYIRSLLQPGIYTISVEAAGFKKTVRRDLALGIGARLGVDIRLDLGPASQSIEVLGAPPPLQTESTVTGAEIESRKLRDLPIGGDRNFASLAMLAAGVVPSEPGGLSSGGGGFSANGVRSNGQNNFLLNGVDNNSNLVDLSSGAAYVVGPSVEAISEMKVMTNGYDAEYGRGAGGVVNITLKSGTNELHGSLYETLQNDKLRANNWFSNRFGAERPRFKQNQFGATAGGPLIKNRTFWFVDYQGIRSRSEGNGQTLTVPYPEFAGGDFSRLLTGNTLGADILGNSIPEGAIFDYRSTQVIDVGGGMLVPVRQMYPGNRIPASLIDPVARKVLSLLPAPNQHLSDRMPDNNYFGSSSGRRQVDQGDIRIDHRLTDKDSLFGTFSLSNEDSLNRSSIAEDICACSPYYSNRATNAMVSWTRVWSPHVLSESRLAYTRLANTKLQGSYNRDLFQEFGIGGFNPYGADNGGLPSLQIDNYSTLGGQEWTPSRMYSNVWDLVENVAVQRGSRSFKAGFEARQIRYPFVQFSDPRGAFLFPRVQTANFEYLDGTGDGMASFLQGIPYAARITSMNIIGSQKSAYAFYFQHDWKASTKLSLNLGMRYELFSPTGERLGRQANLDRSTLTYVIPAGPNQNAPLPDGFEQMFPGIKVERGVASKYLIPWDKTSVAPRLGVAYQFAPRSVARLSYGIFYGGEENQGGQPNRGQNFPFNSDIVLLPPNPVSPAPGLGMLENGFPADVFSSYPANVLFRSVARNLRNAMVHKWSLAIQWELGGNTNLEVSYVGEHGAHELIVWDANQPRNVADPTAATAPRRPIPSIDNYIIDTSSFGSSNYHGLVTKLEKRFSHGLDFLASYTWGHALTDVTTPLSNSPGLYIRDVTNVSGEYSHASWDLRHRFVYSGSFELPFGRDRRLGAHWGRMLDAALGQWQVNGILTLQTGQPFTLNTRDANCGCGGSVLPDRVPGKDPNNAPRGGRTVDQWFDTSAVQAPAAGTIGNLGLQSNFGPPLHNLDLSLFKQFRLGEKRNLQLRAEAMNATNTPHFGFPNITQGSDGFGRINGSWGERAVQFAARIQF